MCVLHSRLAYKLQQCHNAEHFTSCAKNSSGNQSFSNGHKQKHTYWHTHTLIHSYIHNFWFKYYICTAFHTAIALETMAKQTLESLFFSKLYQQAITETARLHTTYIHICACVYVYVCLRLPTLKCLPTGQIVADAYKQRNTYAHINVHGLAFHFHFNHI